MKWFFLSGENFVKLMLATLVIYNFFPLYVSGLWTLAFIFILFIFRKNKVFYKDNFSMNPDMAISPVDGRVVDVYSPEDKDEKIIRIAMSFIGPSGLFMPFEGVIDSLDFHEGNKLWRLKRRARFTNERNRYSLTLRTKNDALLGMDIFRCHLGQEPRIYVEPGDKGKSLACFGYAPFGAGLNLIAPKGSKVLVGKGDRLKAGETALIGLS